MLTKDRVEDLIRTKEIAISYSFGLKEGKFVEFEMDQFVDPDTPESPATKMFARNFFGDRLTVTVGPVEKTHSTRWPSGRAQFKNRSGYFDLRARSLVLEPHETVSISTNERIILRGTVAAATIPRLTNADAGLLYVPSYIDPYWDGILQAVIHNMTDRRQELSLCERVAICRFYRVEGIAPKADAQKFASKSHHFGQSWSKILKEDFDPIPTRKAPVPETPSQRFIGRLREFWNQHASLIKGIGLTGSFVAAAYGVGVAWTNLKRDAEAKNREMVRALEHLRASDLAAVSNRLDAISVNAPRSGVANVRIQKGDTRGKLAFAVTHPRLSGASVWVQLAEVPSNPVEAFGRLDLFPGNPANGEVSIELRRSIQGTKWKFE